jgi:hypothetical protein
LSPSIDALDAGVIGRLSRLKNDKTMLNAVNMLFKPQDVSPRMVKEAKNIIQSRDPELWNDVFGAYMRNVYEGLKKTEGGNIANVAGKLHKQFFGTEKNRKILAGALGPQYNTFKDLMIVFKHAAIGSGNESMTAQFQAIGKELGVIEGSKIYRYAMFPKQALVETIMGRWNDMIVHGRQKELLDALLDPKAIKMIKNMKRMKPGTELLVRRLGVFMNTFMGGGLLRSEFERGSYKDMTPQIMRKGQ